MAQINPTVGDLEGNARLMKSFAVRAADAKANLVAFPEMAVTGYPPLDLLPPREAIAPSGATGQLKSVASDNRHVRF